MSNQAVATIRDAQETAASNGARPLGFVVNYDAESISILRTDLKAIFEEEGFHGYVPEEMDPVAALARAKGRKLPKGIQVDQFDSPNADTPVSYGIYRKVASHGESGDTRECGARVRLDKATGQIVALPPDGMPATAVCLEVAEAIAAAANRPIEGLELSEAAQALDEWIVKGGFLPAAWRRPALDAAAVTEWCERKLVTLGLTMVEGQMSLRVQPKPGSALAHPRIYAPTEGDPAVSVDALIAQAMRDL